VVHAYTAIELLAKAVLAQINVLLIADDKRDQQMLELALSDPRKGIPASVRTITADAALQRTQKMGVPFDRYSKDLAALRKARNVIMHSGNFDTNAFATAWFDAWIRSMVALCEYAEYSLDLVFGKGARLVEYQMGQYADQLEDLWKERKAAALRRWQIERSSSDPATIARKREALQDEYSVENSEDPTIQWLPCPVCSLPALMVGDIEMQAEYAYKGGEDYLVGIYHEFVATDFRCQTCRLRLDSTRLIEESGLLDQWEIDEEDIHRWEDQVLEDYV